VCACARVKWHPPRNQKAIERIRGRAGRKSISEKIARETKLGGGRLVYSVRQTGYSAGRNGVMARDGNTRRRHHR